MHHNFNEKRSILIQDIRELTSTVFPKLLEIYNELLRKGLVSVTVTEMYYWLLCELTVEQYAYQIRNHQSKDPAYSIPYDHIKNAWSREQFSLEEIFKFYIKGPALYVPCHDVAVGLGQTGAEIVFTFYWSESEFRKIRNILTH